MKTRPIALLVVIGLLLTAAQAMASDYTPIASTETRQPGRLVRTETTIQVGTDPLDRFKMIRLVKDVPVELLRGSIFFLPPLGTTFSFYEQRDECCGVGSSIAEFFALRNIDVYGYSPRFEGISAGSCEAGLVDCSAMAGWDLQSMVDDIAYIRSQIELLHPGTEIVAGGASLGGMLAFAVVNAYPDDYDGIFPWEGMLFSADPEVRELQQGYCADAEAQLAAGLVFDGVGANLFKEVAKLAELAPDGLTPIRLFPPQLTNHEVLVRNLSVPAPGPVSMPVPGYLQMNGSVDEDRLFFASEPRVFENIGRFNSYVPIVLVRDVACALAGVDDRHVAELGNFTGSVLAIGGGHGFGPYMHDQLDLLGSNDTRLLLEPAFGHIDHFMTRRHRDYVERPIYHWVKRLFR